MYSTECEVHLPSTRGIYMYCTQVWSTSELSLPHISSLRLLCLVRRGGTMKWIDLIVVCFPIVSVRLLFCDTYDSV